MCVTSRPAVVLILLLVALAGCSKSGPQIAPVHGVVKLDGQPLANADVQFQPDGSQRPSSGRTDANGHYELMYKRGQPGASGYAPGQQMQDKGSKRGQPGASGYAPGQQDSTSGQAPRR